MMIFMRFFLGAIAVYLCVVAALFFMQGKLVYPASRIAMPDQAPVPFRNFDATSSDGLKLRGWYVAAKPGMPTIVYFHGNGDNLPSTVGYHTLLVERGFGLLLTSYRGYSNHEGTPNEQGLYVDAAAFIDALLASGVSRDNLVLYGFSLGTGVASEMAVRYPPKALVLGSPFSSLADAALTRYPFVPVRQLLRDKYDNLHKIAQINAPILIVNGRGDIVFSYKEGSRLAEANPAHVTYKTFPGGHVDFFTENGGDLFVADWLSDQAALQ